MVHGHDVVNQPGNRPPRQVVVADVRPPQRLERVNHLCRIGRGSSTRIREKPSAAAAEIDAESFEDLRSPEVGRNEFADRRGCE